MVLGILAQDSQSGSSLVGLALPVLMIVGLLLPADPSAAEPPARAAGAASHRSRSGDDVMTTGGIFGTIVEIDDDEGTVTVEIAPGTRVRMLRAGISQRFVEDDVDEGDETADEGIDREP